MVQPTVPTTHQRPVPGAGRGSGMGVLRRVRGWLTVRRRRSDDTIVGDGRVRLCRWLTGCGSWRCTRTPTTSRARARRRWRSTPRRAHDVLVVSCTGGERGDVLNPRLKDDPHIQRDLAQVRREEMERAQEILGVAAHLARLRRLGPARGRPAAAAARGLLRARADRGHDRGAGPRDPPVPPARHDDLRRERRLPAPRPHHDPHGVDGGVRGGRRPRGIPARRRAVAAAEDLLQRATTGRKYRGLPRGAGRRGARRARMPSGSKDWEPEHGAHHHHPGRVLRLLRPARPGAARPRHPDRPRRRRGSGCRASCRPGSGRPRTSRRRCPTCRSSRSRTTCSPASPTRRPATRWPPRADLELAYDGRDGRRTS